MKVDWSNKCKITKKGHYFFVKYKTENYCKYCGDCQNVFGIKISEDLLEYLVERMDAEDATGEKEKKDE